MLYQEYKQAVLKKLQAAELEVLKDFSALCEKHKIDYFANGGTLLGAVRHKGFIPWDDDIDIGMTREHYERFLAVAETEYPGKYRLINPEIDSAFPVMLSKWYKTGTRFLDQDAVTTGYEAGIGLDVFCFDNVADDPKLLRRQALRAWSLGKLLVLCKISNPVIYVDGILGKIAELACVVANRILRILPISPKAIYKKAKKAAMKYQNIPTKRVAFLFDPTPYMSLMKRSDIYPTRLMEFEGIDVRVPHRSKVFLHTQYGSDYMTLPPIEKRHNHPPKVLDFGTEE